LMVIGSSVATLTVGVHPAASTSSHTTTIAPHLCFPNLRHPVWAALILALNTPCPW
jgi:hypothetical protein